MELPHIGEHCSEVSCRQLDFLPFTCPLCKKVYCLQHQKLTDHNCPHANTLDVRVPVCPLCNKAVPAPRGQSPDIAISEHLDNNCEVKKEKIFTNKCSYQHCKKKELMPIECRQCGLNFCIPHRHPNDHKCTKVAANGHAARGPTENGNTSGSFLNALRAQAASRFGSASSGVVQHSNSRTWQQQQPPSSGGSAVRSGGTAVRGTRQAAASQYQAGMSEEEALALAIQQSQMTSSSTNTSSPSNPPPSPPSNNAAIDSTDEEAMLQRAIAESLRDTNQQTGRTANRNSHQDCNVL